MACTHDNSGTIPQGPSLDLSNCTSPGDVAGCFNITGAARRPSSPSLSVLLRSMRLFPVQHRHAHIWISHGCIRTLLLWRHKGLLQQGSLALFLWYLSFFRVYWILFGNPWSPFSCKTTNPLGRGYGQWKGKLHALSVSPQCMRWGREDSSVTLCPNLVFLHMVLNPQVINRPLSLVVFAAGTSRTWTCVGIMALWYC